MSQSHSTSPTTTPAGSATVADSESGRASSQRVSSASPAGAVDEADPPSPHRGNASGCEVRVHLETRDVDPPLINWLDCQFRMVTDQLGIQAGRITLSIVDDATMSELHDRFKGEPGPTDVLTFDLRDAPHQPLDAEIVICLDEASRQARQRSRDARLEVLLYAVHGLLHMLGEDDHEPDAAARMHQREDDLLEAVGVGALFNSRSGATRGL